MNFEIKHKMKEEDIVKDIKAPRLRWSGFNIYVKEKEETIRRLTEWRPVEENISRGRPKTH